MKPLAVVGDSIVGGDHCHGHDHGPRPTPGVILPRPGKVCVGGAPVARAGDRGYSAVCCAGIGKIELLQDQKRVFVENAPVVGHGSRTRHCRRASGQIVSRNKKVMIP